MELNIIWQIGIAVGQLLGTIGIFYFLINNIKNELFRMIDKIERQDEKITNLIEKFYEHKEEISEKYLKKEDWIIIHNKMEAEIKMEIKKILEKLEGGK